MSRQGGDSQDADKLRAEPTSSRAAPGIISSVKGRRDGRGVPELFKAEIQHGQIPMQIGMRVPRGEPVPVALLQCHLRLRDFGQCPICFASGPLSREHVPPAKVGGRMLALTCRPCNNIFGSRYEPALQDWYDDAISRMSFAGEAIPGPRSVGRAYLRQTEQGDPLIFISGGAPGIRELLEHGQLQMELTYTRGYEYRIAALKTAYLTCCLVLDQIPETPKAVQVRDELLAARELRKGESPEPSEFLRALRIGKTGQAPVPSEVHIAAIRNKDNVIEYLISYNQFWYISWPLEMGAIVESDGEQLRVFGEDLPRR